jgi:CHAT domain-containing protein
MSALGTVAPPPHFEPPRDGELFLIFHRVPRGWAGFAVETHGTVVRRLGDVDLTQSPSLLSNALLEPFRESIDRAEVIDILAPGGLSKVDFHMLPWNSQILEAQRSVVYKMDLGPLSDQPGRKRSMLIVADPRGDLPRARRTAEHWEQELLRIGWMVDLKKGVAATITEVNSALGAEDTSTLYYTGHGAFAGFDGWNSALELAGATRFEISDVFALPRVPRFAVLSACESARVDDRSSTEGLGIAQAFLLKGAEVVVGTSAVVSERVAEDVMNGLRFGNREALIKSLRETQTKLAQRDSRREAGAFRVLVR